jgi:hypothetical protein
MSRARDIASGTFWLPGEVVQVQHVRTSATRYGIQSQDIAAIPELTIDFVPKFSNSKILIRAMINSTGQHVATFGFLKNNSVLASNSNTNSAGSVATTYEGDDVTGQMKNYYIEFMDTATSTSSINYKAAACASWAGDNSRTLWINDRDTSDMRSFSSMTIQEIKV